MTVTACQAGVSNHTLDEAESRIRAGVVTRVYDGDTVVVTSIAGTRKEVRLAGLNAPEEGECHYRESLDHLTDWLRGREVSWTELGVDQFGRTLAHVWAGDRHVNLALVNRGHAIATTPADEDPYEFALLSAEEDAASRGRGLWSERACGSTGPVPPVRIESVEPDPPGPDAERLADEVVVVVNDGELAVEVGGWMLRDESSRHRYSFAADAVLDGGATVVITSADPGWVPGGGPVWNNRGDLVMLVDVYGRVVDALRY